MILHVREKDPMDGSWSECCSMGSLPHEMERAQLHHMKTGLCCKMTNFQARSFWNFSNRSLLGMVNCQLNCVFQVISEGSGEWKPKLFYINNVSRWDLITSYNPHLDYVYWKATMTTYIDLVKFVKPYFFRYPLMHSDCEGKSLSGCSMPTL